ncbi:MAG: pyridoxal 4-dehydrogenase [Coxiella sp. (in: Bacteria)]|nr:MAG: pyridoxal 4-dehydrogenase [Coxiella sp. (in: g-proteobacteria)]
MTRIKQRQVGQTPLYVTELGFGAASIGNLYKETRDLEARDVLNKCWELGIRFFDTAPEYGHGLAERRMGDALRQFPADDYVLSTKVGDMLYAQPNAKPPENKFINKLNFFLRHDYSYDGIMRCFEDSMQRLGLSAIDLLLIHDLDSIIHQPDVFESHFKTFVDSGYKALEVLRASGAVKAIGLGIKQWEVCERAMQTGQYDCFMLQGNYTLLEQPALDTFLPRCVKEHVSVFIAGPFGSGILATGPVKNAHFHHQQADPQTLQRVTQMQAVCNEFNVPLAAAAIQFPLMHPAISSVVIGSRSADRMQQNVNYYHTDIPAELWSALKAKNIIPEGAPCHDHRRTSTLLDA